MFVVAQVRQQVFIYFQRHIDKRSCTQMVSCNKCGNTIRKPARKLENALFSIEIYKCRKCGSTLKEAHYKKARPYESPKKMSSKLMFLGS